MKAEIKSDDVIFNFFKQICDEKDDVKCVELGKMAVTETHQGKGYGQQLLKHVLETARTLGYTEILLYSSRILQNSIHLYKKYGFKEVSNIDSPYKRGDIKMLIKL